MEQIRELNGFSSIQLFFSHRFLLLLPLRLPRCAHQISVMAMDILKGIQQRKKQSGLTMIIMLIARRADPIDVINNKGLGNKIDFPFSHGSGKAEILIGDFISITLLIAQSF